MRARVILRVADKFVHTYRADSGRTVLIDMTAFEYAALGRKGAASPGLSSELPQGESGWRWLSAAQMLWYDTIDGMMQAGDVCDEGEEIHVILPNGDDVFLSKLQYSLLVGLDGPTIAPEPPNFSLVNGEMLTHDASVKGRF